MQNDTILETIDPEIVDRLVSRRDAIRQGATVSSGVAAALALGSVPVALAVLSREAKAQTSTVIDVLNFALALEIFENEFYKAVLGTSSSAAQNTAFAPVRGLAGAVPTAVATLQQIQKHEAAHVATLMGAGATNVFSLTAASFDFTGNRGVGGPGPFAAATTDLAFLLTVAQGAEDTGVRAYKGQAGNLMSNTAVLETALRIHSVEARHASKIRRMRRIAAGAPDTVRFSGTVRGGGAGAAGATGSPSAAVVAAFGLIYAGEDNTNQGGVNILTLAGANFGTDAATEAFDEPLTRAQVVAIVQPFVIPTIA